MEPGIRLTHVGDALADLAELPRNGISSDGLVGTTLVAVDGPIGEEVSEALFGTEDVRFLSETTEGWGDPIPFTEGSPVIEGTASSSCSFVSNGSFGRVQSRLECSMESMLSGTWSSCQGLGCG